MLTIDNHELGRPFSKVMSHNDKRAKTTHRSLTDFHHFVCVSDVRLILPEKMETMTGR